MPILPKQALRQLIATACTDEALLQLMECLAGVPKHQKIFNNLILLNGQWMDLDDQVRLNLASRKEVATDRGRISEAVLAYLDQLPEHIEPPANVAKSPQSLLLQSVQQLAEDDTWEYDLFFSFSSKDMEAAREFCHQLRGRGLRVFFSADDLRTRGGHNFAQIISTALKGSRHFLLFCSPNAMVSEWVELEHDTFFQQYHLKNKKERGFFIAEGPDFESHLVPEFYRRIQAIRTAEELLHSLTGQKPAASAPKSAPAPIKESPKAEKQTSAPGPAEEFAWELTEEAHSRTGYERFLAKFPEGYYAAKARKYLAEFEADDTAWEFASLHKSVGAFEKYLKKYPKGLHSTQAKEELLVLEREIKAQEAQKVEEARKTDLYLPDMVLVKGGVFLMGSPTTEEDRQKSEHQHEVELSDFYIGKHTVTLEEFATFIAETAYQTDADKAGTSRIFTTKWEDVKGVNWRCDTKGNVRPASEYRHPVLHVSWNDAKAYCDWLSKISGFNYRLLTEAEWEYAARGGGQATLFGNGKNIADPKEINFAGSEAYKKSYSVAGIYRGGTIPVGSLHCPNALGLHDMSGNVWEWCWDWYADDYYLKSPRKNPQGPDRGSDRVMRGGSWGNYPQACRVANRSYSAPSSRYDSVGFRLARTV
jgi:sulfatase modifying factor 1